MNKREESEHTQQPYFKGLGRESPVLHTHISEMFSLYTASAYNKEQVFEEWKASCMPRDRIVKCFYRFWLKE